MLSTLSTTSTPLPTFDDDEEGSEQANASQQESDNAEHLEAGAQFG